MLQRRAAAQSDVGAEHGVHGEESARRHALHPRGHRGGLHHARQPQALAQRPRNILP